MKKTGKKWVSLMLMALCLMTACTSKNGGANPGGAEGNIVTVSQGYETSAVSIVLSKIDGTVDLEDKSGNTLEKREGMFLYNGNRVATSERSYAYLELDDVKAAKMGQFSSMEVRKETKELSLYLEAGEMFFNVEKHLENDEAMNIRTSTMITGIRGTAGFVRVIDFLTTEIYLLDGEVEVTVIDPVTGATKTAVIKAGQKATTAVFKNKRNTDDNVAIMIDSFTEEDVPAYVIEEIAKNGNLQERILLGRTLNTSIMIRDRAKALVRDTETGKMLAMQEEEAAEAWAKGNKLDEMFSDGTEPIEVVKTESTLTDPTLAQVQEALDDERYETVNVEGTFTFGDGAEGIAKLSSVRYLTGFRFRNVDKDGREVLTVPAGKYLNLNGKTAFGKTGAIKNYGMITNYGSLYLGGELENVDEGRFINQGTLVTPEVIDDHEHVAVIDREVKPTCTKDGYTKGSHCKICNAILEPQEVIPATGHKEVAAKEKEPTCTEAGNKAGTKCSTCGEILSGCEEIAELGHVRETVPGQRKTCTTDGYSDGIKCSRCGEWIQKQTVDKSRGHDWARYEGNDVEAENTEADCEHEGIENQYCRVCGARQVKTTGRLGHDMVRAQATTHSTYQAPTCAEGYEELECKRCGYMERRILQPVRDHSYTEVSRTLNDCALGGTRVMWCEVCGNEYTEDIPAQNHPSGTRVPSMDIPATCGMEGEEGYICDVCGQPYTVSIPETGEHDFIDPATGMETEFCMNCGAHNPNILGDPGNP